MQAQLILEQRLETTSLDEATQFGREVLKQFEGIKPGEAQILAASRSDGTGGKITFVGIGGIGVDDAEAGSTVLASLSSQGLIVSPLKTVSLTVHPAPFGVVCVILSSGDED